MSRKLSVSTTSRLNMRRFATDPPFLKPVPQCFHASSGRPGLILSRRPVWPLRLSFHLRSPLWFVWFHFRDLVFFSQHFAGSPQHSKCAFCLRFHPEHKIFHLCPCCWDIITRPAATNELPGQSRNSNLIPQRPCVLCSNLFTQVFCTDRVFLSMRENSHKINRLPLCCPSFHSRPLC